MYQETDMERNFTERNYRILSHATFVAECINISMDYKYNTEQIALFSVTEGGISWQTIGKVVSFDYIKKQTRNYSLTDKRT